MTGVIIGFAIIFSIVLVGYILAKTGIIASGSERLVLNRIAFYSATPALVFMVVSKADVATLLSPVVAVAALSALATAGVYVAVSRIFFRHDAATTCIAAASSAYVNSNNIGLPVGMYVLGNGSYVAPILLFQMALFTPIILAILAAATGDGNRHKVAHIIRGSLLSPMVLGALVGMVVSLLHVNLPDAVLRPLEILGGASIPMILISFGASLHSSRVLDTPEQRVGVLTASVLKVLGMPAFAVAIGAFVFHLDGELLYVAAILAALPTAQNIYNYAATYQKGTVIARDTVLVTTFAALPAMLLISLMFGR
ncbi:AEC family transporter [Corynebacterium durum]|uniref:AEC family transporter n=1 Tax=Corynebacterium durum TaxID=61592 RepID=UPI0028E91315|nr:AEC family transporter [Corynebacterium durum]